MNKLTVFTVILSILVVVLVSELVLNKYFSSVEEGKVEILTTQSPHPSLNQASASTNEAETVAILSETGEEDIENQSIEQILGEELSQNEVDSGSAGELSDVEGTFTEETVNTEVNSVPKGTIDASVLKASGFPDADLVSASFDGSIFQSVDVADLNLGIKKEYVASKNEVFGAVYTFSVDSDTQNELYKVLRDRAAFGASVEVNETNTFGDNSFYMNDARRETTAFLAVRVENKFYCFAYPKKFHSYFKVLVQNL